MMSNGFGLGHILIIINYYTDNISKIKILMNDTFFTTELTSGGSKIIEKESTVVVKYLSIIIRKSCT